MEKKDIPVVHQLLTRYLKQFHLTPVMSREEVEHWFYPQENIIDTFVVEVSRAGRSGLPAQSQSSASRSSSVGSALPWPARFAPL